MFLQERKHCTSKLISFYQNGGQHESVSLHFEIVLNQRYVNIKHYLRTFYKHLETIISVSKSDPFLSSIYLVAILFETFYKIVYLSLKYANCDYIINIKSQTQKQVWI